MSLPATMSRRLETTPRSASARVGVVGAGQLARMLHEAALPLGIEVRVLTDDLTAPAVLAGAVPVLGSPDDLDDLRALAADCDVVTFDHELADHDALVELAQTTCVRPSPAGARVGQDRLLERFRLFESGVPVPAFASLSSLGAVEAFAAYEGWPLMLKAATRDHGRAGSWKVDSIEEAREVWLRAQADGIELLAEAFVEVEHALAVLVARTADGHGVQYPVLETVLHDGVRSAVVAPATVSDDLSCRAMSIAASIAAGLDVVGLIAVEFFVTPAGELIVDELTLRPNDVGHLTIEGCPTSQFEQHLRAILGWPLGSTRLLAPAAAMVAAVGTDHTQDLAHRLREALAVPEVSVHLYGRCPHVGRTLGHVTALGEQPAEVLQRARAAASLLATT